MRHLRKSKSRAGQMRPDGSYPSDTNVRISWTNVTGERASHITRLDIAQVMAHHFVMDGATRVHVNRIYSK